VRQQRHDLLRLPLNQVARIASQIGGEVNLHPGTVLASQAEWQTRLLPALADQLHIETTRCQHAQGRGAGTEGP
jgi:hypothetical protein